ncbi:PD-(D/E)XK nuclease family protein [Armatimonas rosea]|uniref:PD-(D/E)XK nuclease superfamily protein n=1 Tax=Armatimonas rosea TaxID=685828 RepID=A0A7W9W6Q7_ARMRO|nr:PD-(D/E)XK nuclease family protein [Armatimonas rosea]MBB6050431.1 hypothetical protein [Armatimonas rosea]
MISELEALNYDPDLAALEQALQQFNLFEAMGIARQEVIHSKALAFLLDPHQTHGLGEHFLRGFLHHLGLTEPADLSDTEVRTEWERIDILIRCPRARLAVVIENKIGAGEHGDQLKRYKELAARHFAGWKVVFVFLSPLGAPASDPDYLLAEYSTIITLLEGATNLPSLQPEVLTLLTHYTATLRRQVLHENELDALCIQLYQRHHRALDYLYARRADPQTRIREELESLVKANSIFVLDYAKPAARSQVSFVPVVWDDFLPRRRPCKWSAEGRVLLFWFSNQPQSLRLSLQISAGTDPADRARLIALAEAQGAPFTVKPNARNAAWTILYSRELIAPRSYTKKTLEQILDELHASWESFLTGDLPLLNQAIQSIR